MASIFSLSLPYYQVAAAAAKKSGGDFSINIPVRLGLFTGVQSGKSSYAADKKDISTTSYQLGFDFNVPLPSISTLVGFQAWYMGDAKSGNTAKSSMFMIGPYIGYSGKTDDIFIGAGPAALSSALTEDEVTAPITKVQLHKASTCGFLGWRHYFKAKVITGLGLTGYACQSGEYEKTVTTTTEVTTTVSDKVTATGGSLYFIITWGEERKLL